MGGQRAITDRGVPGNPILQLMETLIKCRHSVLRQNRLIHIHKNTGQTECSFMQFHSQMLQT